MSAAGFHLRLQAVTKRYGSVCAVDRVSLDIRTEEFLTLLGPSGSGKTTTLMMIAGFTMPDDGVILLDGEDITFIPPFRRNIGVVFQHYSLFPHMSVFENVAYPLRVRKVPSRQIQERVNGALSLVQLHGYGERYPHQLSGGQQQRVALARAVVFEPRLLLMDEPLGALDKKLREYMQLEIKHLQEKLKITVVYVTHDQAEALTMSDQVALMHRGRLEQLGSPQDLYRRPSNRFVADFVGEACFLEGAVVGTSGGYGVARIAEGFDVRFPALRQLTDNEPVVLMIRPEAIFALENEHEPENQASAVVDEVIYLGGFTKYRVLLSGGQTLYIKSRDIHGAREYRSGESLILGWRIQDTRLL